MKMMFRYSLVALLALVSDSSLTTGNSPLKKPPGEGTGPTRHADLRGNLVGRVPPRGEPDVFQQAAIALRADQVFRHRFAARPGVELFINMLKVGLDRRDRDLERLGDLLGARTLGDLAQNLLLTGSEFFRGGMSGPVLVKGADDQTGDFCRH